VILEVDGGGARALVGVDGPAEAARVAEGGEDPAQRHLPALLSLYTYIVVIMNISLQYIAWLGPGVLGRASE
jgi:hypothetical protein